MKNWILYWHIDPLIILFITIVIWLYFSNLKTAEKGHPVLFWTGILLFIVATLSPLNYLAGHFYFSAHMIAHIIILLIAGPFIVAAIPGPAQLSRNSFLNRFSEFIYRKPWIAWIVGVTIMWVWHIPSVFRFFHSQMTHQVAFIPVLLSGSMLAGGMVFSWPLFGPVQKFNIQPLSGILYLFTACVSCSLLGLLIAFAPPDTYFTGMNSMRMTTSESAPWMITKADDLQAAGLIMWVPCCVVYLSGCFFLLSRYFNQKNPSADHSDYLIN